MTIEQVKAMTDDELRIKVAELCGWVYEGSGNWKQPDGVETQTLYPTGGHGDVVVGMGKYDEEVPLDYPNDLNAMRDAEDTIHNEDFSDDTWHSFLHNLDAVINQRRAHASARQRAEAFVLTMKRD